MNVKEYSVNELVPGMIIAAPVITNAGQILLDVGVTLTRPLIEKDCILPDSVCGHRSRNRDGRKRTGEKGAGGKRNR